MSAPTRPVPVPDAVSAPYWEAAAAHVLTVPRCSRCHAFTVLVDGIPCTSASAYTPGDG